MNKSNKGNSKKSKELEKTNSYDLVFDEDRMRDAESLDVSFIDGKKKKAPKIDMTEYKYEVVEDFVESKKGKGDFFINFLMVFLSFVLGMLVLYILVKDDLKKEVLASNDESKKVEEKIVVSENLVFVGDSIVNEYNLENFYSNRKVVNSGISDDKTADILENLNERIYQYNPSKIFILVGINDIIDGVENSEIVGNIEKIVNAININRPYAEIYIQSIYPVNDVDSFDVRYDMIEKINVTDINSINMLIEDMCKEKNITYVDIYSKLVDDNGLLNKDYTIDGLHINDEGYGIITTELLKYIDGK